MLAASYRFRSVHPGLKDRYSSLGRSTFLSVAWNVERLGSVPAPAVTRFWVVPRDLTISFAAASLPLKSIGGVALACGVLGVFSFSVMKWHLSISHSPLLHWGVTITGLLTAVGGRATESRPTQKTRCRRSSRHTHNDRTPTPVDSQTHQDTSPESPLQPQHRPRGSHESSTADSSSTPLMLTSRNR